MNLALTKTLSRYKDICDEPQPLPVLEDITVYSAWLELVYCILAGTKVSTEIVQRGYDALLELKRGILFPHIYLNPESSRSNISSILKRVGYRFYNSKASTIVDASRFYLNKYASIITRKDELEQARNKLRGVRGIGIKIASHWLRNIGYNVPIIDVHVRRILQCSGLTQLDYHKPLSDQEYLKLEGIVIDLSQNLNVAMQVLDLAMWNYGRAHCNQNECQRCSLKK